MATAVDSKSNVLVAGYFEGVVTFGGTTLSTAGNYNLFVAKYSPSGSFSWAQQYGGGGSGSGKAMALDASGNIFVGVSGGSSGALMKLDSAGNVLWTVGPVPNSALQQSVNFASIAVDSQGNALVTGSFSAWANLLDFGNNHPMYSSYGGTSAFLAKYSTNGTCLWVTAMINGGSTTYGNGVAVDASGNVFLAGYALGNIQLVGVNGVTGPQLVNGIYATFGYLGKFDASGNLLWSEMAGSEVAGDASYAGCRLKALSIDSSGNLIAAGEWGYAANFGGGARPSYATGGFVAQYAGTDGHWLWDVEIGGAGNFSQNGVALDGQNNIFVTGQFNTSYNFGAHTLATSNPGNGFLYDGFVAKYNSAGVNVWAADIGSASPASGNAVAVGPAGYPVVTGGFVGNISLAGQSLTGVGATDIFLGRLSP